VERISPRMADGESAVAIYEIMPSHDGWLLTRNHLAEGTLDTKMAAFDSAVEAAMADLLAGRGIVINVASNADEERLKAS
jgi:hypothetical protein